MQDAGAILDFLNRGGILAVFVGLGWALHKKWLVLGWTYTDCDTERATARNLAHVRADKLEAKLDRAEDQRVQNARP